MRAPLYGLSLALSALVLLAGCGSDAAAPGGNELSAATAADAGAAAQDDVEEATESFTVGGQLDPAASFASAAPAAPPPSAAFLQDCASIGSGTDTDGDGAPEVVTCLNFVLRIRGAAGK